MSIETRIAHAYEAAKQGRWERVLHSWAQDAVLAQECSRFQKHTSGWTFLHQAAYFGHEAACRELIRRGAAVDARSVNGESAADIAEQRTYAALAVLLRRAAEGAKSLWQAPRDASVFPGSCLWGEAQEQHTAHAMQVAYGGGLVQIPAGSRHYVDSFGRTLVGWHGTYNPPCGMGGESMVGDD